MDIKQPDNTFAGQPYDPRSTSFGQMLRIFRDEYPTRIGGSTPGTPTPKMRLTALALIECMRQSGYPITSGFFSEVESGASYPKDGQSFINAVSSCLQLSPMQQWQLTIQLSYDVVKNRLGEEIAIQMVSHLLPQDHD